jgi:hypothetical protein
MSSHACQECGENASVTSEAGFFFERCEVILDLREERDEARKIARHCLNILRACGLHMGAREEIEAPDWLTVNKQAK